MSQKALFPVAEEPAVLRARTATEVFDALERVVAKRFSDVVQTMRVLDESRAKLEENTFATSGEKERVIRQRQMCRCRALELLDVADQLATLAREKYGQQWRFRAVLERKGEVGR